MVNVTLFTRPACGQCVATKRHLDRKGIPYDTVDISTNATALEMLTEQGFRQAPVLWVAGGSMWSGYNPDKIDALAAQLGL